MHTPVAFKDLTWKSRFVDRLPGDPIQENFTRPVRGAFYSKVHPTPVRLPKLLGWSDALGSELGIQRPDANDLVSLEILGGNRVLPAMKPYSARYGGHQFGNWAGQLGDGRAITLGEVATPDRGLMEFQLKGAGPTPYSRRADGRAVLRSSVREFLCSEAMHFLGIPTTRALSLVATGDEVVRDLFYDGNPKAEPGAIVCRVSPSFLRFGNFEILTANEEIPLLKTLVHLLIEDHYPFLQTRETLDLTCDLSSPDIYGKLLDEVSRRTAHLIAEWMRVGFVHGVMNTDNMSILGLTIDYGPYGWLEPYEPEWTPNTTDAEGRRYCYGNQPNIGMWNIARLCESFFPLIQDEARLQESLMIYRDSFQNAYSKTLAQKLGLSTIQSSDDQKLVQDLFQLLQRSEGDYTLFFRNLSNGSIEHKTPDSRLSEKFFESITPTFYSDLNSQLSLKSDWMEWSNRYFSKIAQEGQPSEIRSTEMKKANPKYVLRNYLAQNAITAAEKGDLSVLERLMRVLKRPYDELPADEDLAVKRPDWARNAPGCSALSCSS
jgi:uncharacterized protein YdiU (UPF0061 family)